MLNKLIKPSKDLVEITRYDSIQFYKESRNILHCESTKKGILIVAPFYGLHGPFALPLDKDPILYDIHTFNSDYKTGVLLMGNIEPDDVRDKKSLKQKYRVPQNVFEKLIDSAVSFEQEMDLLKSRNNGWYITKLREEHKSDPGFEKRLSTGRELPDKTQLRDNMFKLDYFYFALSLTDKEYPSKEIKEYYERILN